METVDTFRALYRKLDEYLQHHVEPTRREATFAQQIDDLAQKHPVFRRNAARLKDYGDLRNAITHQRDRNGGIMAIPTEEAVQEFKQIVDSIFSPPKLIPRFQKSDIRLFLPHERLVTALQDMRENDYSQVVVQTEGNLSLLTVEGIARWLEKQAQEEDIISLQEAVIADALRDEPEGSFYIVRRSQTVYDAMEIFTRAIEQEEPRIYALLITDHGKATERILGIVTPWDLLPSRA